MLLRERQAYRPRRSAPGDSRQRFREYNEFFSVAQPGVESR
jgi:hypothetical protein